MDCGLAGATINRKFLKAGAITLFEEYQDHSLFFCCSLVWMKSHCNCKAFHF
jgi:hypothetical protein